MPVRETTGNFFDFSQPFQTGIPIGGDGPITGSAFYFNHSGLWPPKIENGASVFAGTGVFSVGGNHGPVNWGFDFLTGNAKAGAQNKPGSQLDFQLGGNASIHLLQLSGGFTMPAADYLISILLGISPAAALPLIMDKLMNDNPKNLGTVSILGFIGIGAERFLGLKIDGSGLDFGLKGGGKETKGITSGINISWTPPCD